MEEGKKMKCYKRLIKKQFVQISGLYGPHSFWVICQNVSRTFVELCMETPYWCTVLVHHMAAWNQQKYLEFTFSIKALFFTRELEYVRINIFSNTWNGYTAEDQEERLFFKETAFLFWCHALWKLRRKFKLLYFRNETCYVIREWKLVQRFIFCVSST